MKIKHLFGFFLILSSSFTIVGCNKSFAFRRILLQSYKISSQDLIGTDDCSPPCWKEIIPNKTKFEEVIFILDEMVNNDPPDITDYYVRNVLNHKQISVKGYENASIEISMNEFDVVSRISLSLYEPEELEGIIQLFGEPETYDFYKVDDVVEYRLNFPDLGVQVYLFPPLINGFSEETPVYSVDFLYPGFFSLDLDSTGYRTRPWTGYGEIQW